MTPGMVLTVCDAVVLVVVLVLLKYAFNSRQSLQTLGIVVFLWQAVYFLLMAWLISRQRLGLVSNVGALLYILTSVAAIVVVYGITRYRRHTRR